jgi:S1-C subfamily serine protease
MCRAFPVSILVLLGVLFGRAAGQEHAALKEALALQSTFEEAIKKAEPAVACILVARSPEAKDKIKDRETVPESFGSGVVIDAQGLILTNYHVVREHTALYVRLPGDKGGEAQIYAADPRSDLAVLKVVPGEHGMLPLTPIKMGDGGKVRKGQFVISLANPFAAGFHDGSPSASWGILSNIRRRSPGREKITPEHQARRTLHDMGDLLQIDARLNLGCSGGALIDLKGELIGLTTALAALSGSETAGGFAVPMNAAVQRIINLLKAGKEVEYGFLGVSLGRDQRGPGDGVFVQWVIGGSPAARAGLRPGDKILSVNGAAVRDQNELFLELGSQLAGAEVHLGVANRSRPVTATLAKFYVDGPIIASVKPPWRRGMRVEYTSVQALRYAQAEIPQGVYVREVEPGSAADNARLQDTVIVQVNDHPVSTPADFYREVDKSSGPVDLTLSSRDERGFPRKVKLD